MGKKVSLVSGQTLRVHFVDDDYLAQLGMKRLFETLPDIALECVSSTGDAAIRDAVTFLPDVVLMETKVRNVDGVRAVREISRHAPRVRIAMLSSATTYEVMSDAYRAGAASYLFKETISEDLGAAIRMIHRGHSIFSMPPELERFPVSDEPDDSFEFDLIRRLSARDRDILAGLTAGQTNAQIGASLHVSEGTVKAQITKIMTKLNVGGRVQLAVLAVKAGLPVI
jgi:DNA-binding NarL/FixJ family response regulator